MSQDRVSPAFLLIVTLAVGTGMANASENCFYDIDDDGSVGAGDLSLLLGAWGGGSLEADLDGSGLVDAGDLALLLGAWGPCPEEQFCFAGTTRAYSTGCGAAADATVDGALLNSTDGAFEFDPLASCFTVDGLAGGGSGFECPMESLLQFHPIPYQVEGATFVEARRAIFGDDGNGPNGPAPIGSDGNQYAGYTYPDITIIPSCSYNPATNKTWFSVCRITFDAFIEFPEWNAPASASASDLADWETLQSRIINHEMEHLQILAEHMLNILMHSWGNDEFENPPINKLVEGPVCPEYDGDTVIPGSDAEAVAFVIEAMTQIRSLEPWLDMLLLQELHDVESGHGDVFRGLPE